MGQSKLKILKTTLTCGILNKCDDVQVNNKVNDVSINNPMKCTWANTLKQLNDVRVKEHSKLMDFRSRNDGVNNDVISLHAFLYKQHFYRKSQAEIG